MLQRHFFLLFALLLAGCSGPYMGKEMFGADEFVLDSYKIREGKFSILEMEGKSVEEFEDSWLDEYKDTIHEDDVLAVALYNPARPDIGEAVHAVGSTIGYRVTGGKITLPDLSSIPVAGLTLAEAKERIEERYQQQIRDTEIFLAYKDRIARKVELGGLTALSSVPVDGRIRLFDVLCKAQIPSNANLFKSYILRDGKYLPVDMNRLLKEGDMKQNIVMRGADKIYIAEPGSAYLMMMGEVGREGTIALPAGYISLREALAIAGGIPYTGDKSYIQIIRGNIARPKIYTLGWEHVIHLPNDSLLLMAGDIVYVAPKPITEWNRFISQIIPALSGLNTLGSQGASLGVFVP